MTVRMLNDAVNSGFTVPEGLLIGGNASALPMARDTPYGFVSHVYTGDLAAGLREQLDSGMYVAAQR